MKKLLYKGIEFDDFQLYKEVENSSGCEYGYPTDENLNTKDWEEADVYICPHCIKKYNLYSEADTCVETVEQYISGEFDDGMHSMTCGCQSRPGTLQNPCRRSLRSALTVRSSLREINVIGMQTLPPTRSSAEIRRSRAEDFS